MRWQKIKVLLVDHDHLLLRLLTTYLQLEGYDVCAADNSQQAIAQVEICAPDLVLLDIAPYQRDATTICLRIRERSQAPIVCIAAAQRDEMSGPIELSADESLSHPFDADELLALMQRALQRGLPVESERPHAPIQSEDTRVKTMGDLRVDFAHNCVLNAGREIPLSPESTGCSPA